MEVTYDHERDDDSNERNDITALVVSYGVNERLDVILTAPHQSTRSTTSSVRGAGDTDIGAKWRFWELGNTSLALRPGISIPTGDGDRGMGSGRVSTGVFAVLSHEPSPWGFHVHLGWTHNRNVHGERLQIYHGSVAATYRSSPQWQWVTDISAETSANPAFNEDVRSAVLGAIWTIRPSLDLDLGYRGGLSDVTPDHAWLVGLSYRF